MEWQPSSFLKRPVGVDVQLRSDKIRRIQHKFVGEQEQAVVNAEAPDLHYHICWSAKEALFKVYALGQIDFRRHLFVDLPDYPESEGIIGGRVIKEGKTLHCQIKYRFIQEYILVYAIQIQD